MRRVVIYGISSDMTKRCKSVWLIVRKVMSKSELESERERLVSGMEIWVM